MESQVIDPWKTNDFYVEGNDWALPYKSSYFAENDLNPNKQSSEIFKHVNCCYLSTPGRPPTLAALKQHAQSLAVLVQTLAPSQGPGEINNANTAKGTAKEFVDGEAFDWLNDLETPYSTHEPAHHRPLNSLVNLVKTHSDTKGTEYHCPLDQPSERASVKNEDVEKTKQRGKTEEQYQNDRQSKPFARHMNILMHANELLEILDHEFSATGGLLSILPTEHEVEAAQFEDAKTTLIGQWLLFTQQLVARMHDLEIAYANSLDLLAREAVVPMQHMSAHGPDGRSGREIVLPQDQWVLANAGEDVLSFMQQTLDRKQREWENSLRTGRARGVSGEVLSPHDAPTGAERGIVYVDLITRYYRLTGHGHDRGPIFILPAYADRPGTKYTRQMEDRPTVVSVPTPMYPERMSEWETRMKGKEDNLSKLYITNTQLSRDIVELQNENRRLKNEVGDAQDEVSAFRNSISPEQSAIAEELGGLKEQLKRSKNKEAEEKKRADQAEGYIQGLLPNEFSWSAAAGKLPRTPDGQLTDQTLKSMLHTLKMAHNDNAILKGQLDQLAKASKSSGTGTKTITKGKAPKKQQQTHGNNGNDTSMDIDGEA
ncbi:hypothetical protein BJ170DRAFT_253263 [Xylariales sp. AK1849]|nr:hypothetical protein BJ170DRAFT_253263 [Xylariales sp. AK1849]